MDFNRNRIKLGCRRGMLELDLFLIPFFEFQYDLLNDQDKATFVTLLTEQDPDLFTYFMGEKQPPVALEAMVEKIRKFKTSPDSYKPI